MATEDGIREVLAKYLPPTGTVLEVASGTGEHLLHFARHFPDVVWQPSERDPDLVAAIAERRKAAALPNVLEPIELDITNPPWSIGRADAVVCIDVAHLVPYPAVAALFGGVAKLLASNGLLYVYGPFKIHGKYAAKEHEDLDLSLRASDPALGLRDIRELTVTGTRTGLGIEHVVAMKGALVSLIFRRRSVLPPTGKFTI